MKIKFVPVISLFLIPCSSFAQITFQKVIPALSTDYSNAVQQTADSGYIVVGNILDSVSYEQDIYLVKTDKNGDTLWTRTFGGSCNNVGYSVQQTTDGGYIISGSVCADGANPGTGVIKTDAHGDTLWTKVYETMNADPGNYIQQTYDGGYIIAGSTDSYGVDSNAIYLIKTDSSGTTSWTKMYGDTIYAQAYCVRQTADSGYIICGAENSFGAGGKDVYLIKTDANGDTLWTKAYGGAGDDIAHAVEQTADGGYIITGETFSFDSTLDAIFLIKTNAAGDTLWTSRYTASDVFGGSDVHQTADGGYIFVGGQPYIGDSASQVYLIKTDNFGNIAWSQKYGGAVGDFGNSVKQTTDGGYIIAGITYSFVDTQQISGIYLIKTDGNGNSACNQNSTSITAGYATVTVEGTNTFVSSGGTASAFSPVVGSAGHDSTLCLDDAVREFSNANTFSLYPNPVREKITIYDLRITIARIEIYNVLGQVCKQSEIVNRKSEIEFDVSSLPSGLYFVRITDDKQSWTGKFAKE